MYAAFQACQRQKALASANAHANAHENANAKANANAAVADAYESDADEADANADACPYACAYACAYARAGNAVEPSRRHTSPEAAPVDPGVTGGAEDGVGGGGAKRWLRSCTANANDDQTAKIARTTGAIIAPSRTSEGFALPSGNKRTCLPDAAYAGIRTLAAWAPEREAVSFRAASLARLRALSVPNLGNEQEASWETLANAFLELRLPVRLEEATARFNENGGPFLNLLAAAPGVYIVSLCVTVDGKKNYHAVLLSTISEKHAPFGRLVDNHAKSQPVYLQKKDRRGREAAKSAWHKFLLQNPAARDAKTFTATVRDVYQLVVTDV